MGIEFGPLARETVQVKFEPERVAGTPLHVTPATPERLSLSLPFTPIVAVLRLMVDPPSGEAMVTVG